LLHVVSKELRGLLEVAIAIQADFKDQPKGEQHGGGKDERNDRRAAMLDPV